MTEVYTTPALTLSHLMCSQSTNIQDLASHSPSGMVGQDAELDHSSRQDYNTQSLPSDMVRYMMTNEDVRYTQDPGTSHSPVYPNEPAVQSSFLQSTLTSPPYTLQTPHYQHTPLSSAYPSAGNFSYPPSQYSVPGIDNKPRIGSSMLNSSGLGPLSRSSALPHPSHSPISTRDQYTSSQPTFPRRNTSDYLSRSPSSASGLNRNVTLSPSTSGFTSPISNMDNSLGGAPAPPLGNTEIHCNIINSNHEIIKPEIFGRIDKGFFQADGDWTCYRRNYFSLSCSYTLHPSQIGSMYLQQPHGQTGPQIAGFAMSIAAVVDGRGGKSIDLVQHTPKRDKGPQDKPARINLAPRQAPVGMFGDSMAVGRSSLYDNQTFTQNSNQPAQEAIFERIQFKNATANNGKRRAAQQYYHILVELFADQGQHAPPAERWVKVASRMSAQMVVRGRSPGHYQSDRRGSASSGGPGGNGGGAGAGGYAPPGSAARAPGDINMTGTSSMMGGSGYGGHSTYDARGGMYRSVHMVEDRYVTEEEAKVHPSYLPVYFPHDSYADGGRHGLPSIKPEYNSGHLDLPRLNTFDVYARPCRPFDTVIDSKQYMGMNNGMMYQHETAI